MEGGGGGVGGPTSTALPNIHWTVGGGIPTATQRSTTIMSESILSNRGCSQRPWLIEMISGTAGEELIDIANYYLYIHNVQVYL